MELKYGLFTPYTLRFHSDYYNESSSAFLKRCMVLFDQLTYISHPNENPNFIEEIIRNEESYNVDSILKSFKPITEFVSADFLSDMRFKVNPESNLCYGPYRNEFLTFIKDFLTLKFGFDAYNVQTAKEFEILDYYVTALSADFDFLFQLSKRNEEFSALYTELHRDAYFATYEGKTNIPERVLEKVCSINYFDFGKLSWNQIFELKESHFLKDFRQKFVEWLNEFNETKNEEVFEKNIEKFIFTSNFEFLKANKPEPIKDLAFGILGNIPVPIVNPISIYSSVLQIRKDIKNRNEFGWLFFIQEAFHKSKQTKPNMR